MGDLTAIGCLLLARPAFGARAESHALLGFATLAPLAAVIAAGAIVSYSPTVLADDGTIIGQGPVVICFPDDWVGKRLPLIDHIDVGNLAVRRRVDRPCRPARLPPMSGKDTAIRRSSGRVGVHAKCTDSGHRGSYGGWTTPRTKLPQRPTRHALEVAITSVPLPEIFAQLRAE
jgi:hypothetical protein